MSYIEREALMATVNEWEFSIEDFDCFVQALEQIPAADVAPVVHGEWEKQSGIYSCSVCWKTCPYHVEAGVLYYWHCEFCPHCGAKMDGGKHETD